MSTPSAKLLLLATAHGISILKREGSSGREIRRGLAGLNVTSVIAREGVILAGTTQGVFRSDDFGRNWQEASTGLDTRHVRWMAYHPDISDFEFAGTEPAGIYVSHDGAATWRPCPEVVTLRDRHKWFLPYSSEAGCVRGFAFHGTRVYAAVEVGGVLRSDDRGETWRLAGGSSGDPGLGEPPPGVVYPDVHSLAVHPSSPDLVFAATGNGFYGSTDGGDTWSYRYEDCYCRACWLDPADADHMMLGPASNVNRNGRIEETRDGGRTWRMASSGLSVPWRNSMVERFSQFDEELFAILSDGRLLVASLATLDWRQMLPEIKHVAAATWLEEI
ncbi:MAG: exo-alpha-sialidase [Chloroflexi bacterium]|nr:exo-alpha-sialidase [Chloroflexota bacterium]